ncbi:unnamed protein product [Symbiodinium natans]|uniref:Uncharacterized protein n=1 Tax=Symbiodinium natans TaxID=878477 RepID=A0A812JUN5_9DINO|nr:unnamed protein product [Symbiodinium natans]
MGEGPEIGAAVQLTDAILSVLEQIQASPESANTKVRAFGRLIEDQRSALHAHGIASFADFQELCSNAARSEALERLAAAEAAWRQTLGSLEVEANREVQRQLQPGDTAPGFVLPERGGKELSLHDLLDAHHRGVLLIWLRHYG